MSDFSQLFNNEDQSILYKSRPEYSEEIVEEIIQFWRSYNIDCSTDRALNIIDVGCGTGQLTKELIPYSKSLIGIDSSPSQIREAQGLSIGHDNVKFMVCNCTELPVSDGTVDLITAAQCVHWFDVKKFYIAVNKALKVGGVLVILAYAKGHFIIDEFEDLTSDLNKFVTEDIWFDDQYFGLLSNKRLRWSASCLSGIPFLYHNTGIRNNDLCIQMKIDLHRYSKYIQSTSMYQRWKREHPEKKDIADIIMEKILFYLGYPETGLDTILEIKFPLSLIMCRKE